MRSKSVFPGLIVVFILCSCGGGGGGGGSSSHGVRLLHSSLDDAPLAMTSVTAATEVLQTSRFAEPGGYVAVSSGEQRVSVEGGQVGRIQSQPFTVAGGDRYSVLFYRNVSNDAPSLKVLDDAAPELESGQSAVRIVHALSGAAVLEAEIGGNTVETTYASGGEYVVVPAGSVSITVRRQADGLVVFSGMRTVESGKTRTLFMSGEINYFVSAALVEG